MHHHSTQASLLGLVRDGPCVCAQGAVQGAPGAAGSVVFVFRTWARGLPVTPTTPPGVWVSICPALLPAPSLQLDTLLCISVLGGALENEYCDWVCM